MSARNEERLEPTDELHIRRKDLRFALLLTYITVGWMTIEGAAALLLGWASITDTHESIWGILIGAVAKVGMPILGGYKLKVAARLNSGALRADAIESITCGYLSIVLMIGLAATWWLGWWWLDSVAALSLIPFLIKEARAAISGESCSACNDTSLRTSIRDQEGGG
jgi:divalent metal cation (Fe/Co/Zn/Cd) transporter